MHISGRRREVDGRLEWDDRFTDLEEYLKIARAAQAARIDAVFLADHPVLYRNVTEPPKHTLDPLIILSMILAAVPDIGGIYTASTTLNHPYNLARRLQSLNWLSKGRVGWNVVATWNPDVAENYGNQPLGDHASRYSQADEATDVVRRLWQSWDQGGEGDHTLRGQPIDHDGEYFSIKGPLTVPNAPFGPPVICQAGASSQGIALGGTHADIIYAVAHSKKGTLAYRQELLAAATKAGRSDPTIRILPGLRVITGSTSEEVARKAAAEDEATPVDGPRAERLAEQLSLNFGQFDPDAPLVIETLKPGGSLPQGFFRALVDLVEEENLSFRQVLQRRAENHRLVVGTPNEIADDIETWWRSGAVDGFTFNPHSVGEDLSLILEEVVPILQSRGLYPREYEDATLRERYDLEGRPRTTVQEKRLVDA
nr:NtaA/DmoA family FMN-dependent monooxygenase [Rhizobium cellulosilyticum]